MWGQTFPNAQKRSKSWSFAPLAFWAFPLSAGGLRPEGPLKPASSAGKGGEQPQGAGVPLRTETLEKLSSAPGLFKRGCAGQVAHRVSFLPASRTHAVLFGCKPTPGFCFPRQGKSSGASPTHRNARKAGALLLWLFGRFPYQPAVCGPKGRLSRPAARGKGVSSLRAQASPFAQKRLKS